MKPQMDDTMIKTDSDNEQEGDYGSWEPVIGLEVHAQLLTESKLFCGCSTRFGAAPNAHTCPVCMGFPGVLHVLNEQALEFSIRTGLATGSENPPLAR